MRLYTHIIISIFFLALLGCSKQTAAPAAKVSAQNSTASLKKDNKVITFVTTNGPNTYYINSSNEPAGLEYDLAKLFVQNLGADYQLKVVLVDNFSQVIPTLLAGKADIAASDITITEDRKKIIDFSEPYEDIQQQIAYNRDVTAAPRKLKTLEGQNITVPAGSSFAERLRKISTKVPGLAWEERPNVSSELLLEALANQKIEYTIADNHLLAVMQYYYPNVGMGFSIGEPEKIAWAVKKDTDSELLVKVNSFLSKIKRNGVLRNLVDRYHGNTKRLNPFDVKSFLASTQTLMPKYERLFKSAQDVTNIDWRLLASISYQESHWNTFNTSPTNVRGLMMLTEETSDMMKVTNRLDPNQSIVAGAKFFLWLKSRFPDRIEEPDKTFMALAAYNVGFGHVEDARVLAQRLSLNPDSWADVKKAMVMLVNPKYYAHAKYGYCGCGAPVIYAESIRSYYQILEKHQPSHNPDLDPYKIAQTQIKLAYQ